MRIYRQGDIMLFQRPIPAFAYPRKKRGDIIVAAGEATGHHHRIASGAREFAASGRRFLEVKTGGANLTHEEHATLTLEPGTYEIRNQREYDQQNRTVRVVD